MDGASLYRAKLEDANLQGAWLRGASLKEAELFGTNLQNVKLQGADLRYAKIKDTYLKGAQLQATDLYGANIQCSFGEPESWDLAWMHDASFDAIGCATCSSDRLSENLGRDIQFWWNEGTRSPSHLTKNIEEIRNHNICLSENSLDKSEWVIFGKSWSDCKDIATSEYWEAWADWTVEFACQNEYTGHMSIERWDSTNPLFDLEECISPDDLNQAKQYILGKLEDAAKDAQCPGLRTVPDGRWNILHSD